MEQKEELIPVAEMFDSIAGEGDYVGARFFFIRLAGCTVGKPVERHYKEANNFPDFVERCTLFDGRKFFCDTNFRSAYKVTAEEIVNRIPHGIKHVCITGGEPFMHDIRHLVNLCINKFLQVHIETSGTIHPEWLHINDYKYVWISVSPKLGYLHSMIKRANEIKILVDAAFDVKDIPSDLERENVFLQPVNGIFELDKRNIEKCIEALKQFPNWRISPQLHKILGVR